MSPSYLQPQTGEERVTNVRVRFHKTKEVPLSTATSMKEQPVGVLKQVLSMTEDEIDELKKHGIVLS